MSTYATFLNNMHLTARKSFALIFAIALVALLVTIAGAFFFTSFADLSMAERASRMMRAYYAADAGMARKFSELRDGSTSAVTGTLTLGDGSTASYTATATLTQGGLFSVYRIDSTGTYKNVTRRVSLTVRQISCARYSYLSDSENQLYWWYRRPIWFVTGDILRGPLHTNDQLNISGDPTFEGPVTSTSSTINYYHGGPPTDNPEFRDSLTLGAPSVQLPSSTEILTNIRTAAQDTASGGLYLSGNSSVTLLSDGTMNVTNTAKGWTNHNMALPTNHAVYVNNGYVNISGTLNGQLTVGTSSSIYITNNVVYNSDPRTNPSSTDLLGLVAQNNVYIDNTAPFDVTVHAYIVALNTSFTVENYDSTLKGTLSLYGGITQETRGPIGTFNSSTNERVSGYTKDYDYDDRLQLTAPFYFPPARDANGRIVYTKVVWAES